MIYGVSITPLAEFKDERGSILHMLRSDASEFERFGECYFSEISPGSIKAWKRHRLQTQNIAAPVGRVRVVIYDDRESSPTRGNLDVVELGRPDSYARLRIPTEVWYGFACISSISALLVNCVDVPHDPSDNETRPSDDSAIPYTWTLTVHETRGS